MRGSGTTILVIQIKNVKRKTKYIKSNSKKLRTKKYKISFLYENCHLIGSSNRIPDKPINDDTDDSSGSGVSSYGNLFFHGQENLGIPWMTVSHLIKDF